MEENDKTTRVRLALDHDYQFVATFPDNPSMGPLRLDEEPPLGDGRGPNPAALLATAVGDCLGSSLLFCLRKARLPVDALDISVEARLVRNEAGRYRVRHIDVVLSPKMGEVDAGRLQRCLALFEDFCIVTESVRHGIEVNVNVTAGDRGAESPTAA